MTMADAVTVRPGVPGATVKSDQFASTVSASIVPRYRVPLHYPGQRIGLFGGTFDPPHEAHLAACLLAMKRLALDRVWWLVTPGNPLKDTGGLAPLDERVAAAIMEVGCERLSPSAMGTCEPGQVLTEAALSNRLPCA